MPQYYRIAERKYAKGHVCRGVGKSPLQDRFPAVEKILEARRPKDKCSRADSVYLNDNKDFSKVGVTYQQGYIHTVEPKGENDRRDMVWTGILQKRYIKDDRFRKDVRPDLTDDQVADKWWSGEGSETPEWEWVTKEATVVDVDDSPTPVRPRSSL
jgi:hypothetical protein